MIPRNMLTSRSMIQPRMHNIGRISIAELRHILINKSAVVVIGRYVLSSDMAFSDYFVSTSFACKYVAVSEIIPDSSSNISDVVLDIVTSLVNDISMYSIHIKALIRPDVVNAYVERSVNNFNSKNDYPLFDIYVITEATVITELPKITIEI